MPSRIIREGILTSETVCSLSWPSEVLYRRLMSVADDYGRFHSIPKLIRAACYPLQIDKVSDADIGKWLTECVEAALVSVYPASDGKRYLQVVKFGQQVRAKSKFPEPMDGIPKQLKTSDNNCSQVSADAHLDVVVVEDVVVIHPPAKAVDLFSGISPEVVRDFKALRKAKKAAITQTAVDGIQREAGKAGVTFEQALRTCCERGWAGFKADWLSNTVAVTAPAKHRKPLGAGSSTNYSDTWQPPADDGKPMERVA